MNRITKECRLCGSAGPHETIVIREMLYGSRERFEYFSCNTCDTLQLVNVPAAEDLARYYPVDYHKNNVSSQPKALLWVTAQQDRYQLHTGGRPVGVLLTKLLPDAIVAALGEVIRILGQLELERDARILDVGCAGGALLDRLARAGFKNLLGADPFIPGDGETPLGVPLLKRYLTEVTGKFDLIMFNHSLEHVPDPLEALKAAHERLAPGGVCLARVPTTSSEAWDTYQADWVQIDAPRHIVIPSRKGMELAAAAAGLKVEKTIDDSNSFQFIGSEKYQRDVALADPKTHEIFGPKQIWELLRSPGLKQIWDWEKRAQLLNRQSRGDQAGFILRAS